MKRLLRLAVRAVGIVLLLAGVLSGALWWYLHPTVTVTRDIVYGQRHGKNLVLHVMRPEHPSGRGILVMISGRWKSQPENFQPWLIAPLLRQGQTIIAVGHLSQPEVSVMETVDDVKRAVRFTRLHAADFGIDPQRMGITGGSSGGHLSLMLATCGGPGDPASPDPVERESCSVQAAAVFFPVTDLIELGPSTENLHDGGPPKSFRNAFGPKGTDLVEWQKIGHAMSPIDHITPALPPIFIIHGGADTLVPLDQSERFKKRAAEQGHAVELIVRPGQKHGWLTILWDVRLFAQWFQETL